MGLMQLMPATARRFRAFDSFNADASVLGKPARGSVSDLATGGTDQFLDEAFVKRFLSSYLNYSLANVDDHWAASLNLMTRNLRAYTLKALQDDDTRGKIDAGQIQSVFLLREMDPVPGDAGRISDLGEKAPSEVRGASQRGFKEETNLKYGSCHLL
jgi:hypothetical protein